MPVRESPERRAKNNMRSGSNSLGRHNGDLDQIDMFEIKELGKRNAHGHSIETFGLTEDTEAPVRFNQT